MLTIAEHLDVPLRARNRLLLAAGLAPAYAAPPSGAAASAAVLRAVQQVLQAHEPRPAIALDRHWNLVAANSASAVLLDGVSEELLREPVNMMRLAMHPDGFAARLVNLAEIRSYLLPRLARQAAANGDIVLEDLHSELLGYGPPLKVTVPDPAQIGLVIRLAHEGEELAFLSTVTTFGAAFDLSLDEIVMETYFPADEITAAFLDGRARHPE